MESLFLSIIHNRDAIRHEIEYHGIAGLYSLKFSFNKNLYALTTCSEDPRLGSPISERPGSPRSYLATEANACSVSSFKKQDKQASMYIPWDP